MKKLIVIALAVVMALSVIAFAACGGEKTYEGEYSYAHPYAPDSGAKYGAKVKVTVKGGVILSVAVEDDTDTFFNLTSSWDDKATWQNGQAAFLKSFEGLKVADIQAIKVACADNGVPSGITGAPSTLKVVTGATQSSGRVILAVQNALKDVK